MKFIAVFTAAIALLIAAGCGANDATTRDEAGAVESQSALPAGLFLKEAPADPTTIKELKSGDHAGEEVLITGRIGGRAAPFVEKRAMFTMTDLELPVCQLVDHCETPWDSCCETPETINANMITVQIVDDQGEIVKRDVDGANGLEPLARLTVRGKISQQDGDVVILDAREIFVHPDRGEMNVS